MKDQISFIIKVLIASWILSLGIKYSETLFVIAPTNINAMIIVFTPCILMASFLSWKYLLGDNNN